MLDKAATATQLLPSISISTVDENLVGSSLESNAPTPSTEDSSILSSSSQSNSSKKNNLLKFNLATNNISNYTPNLISPRRLGRKCLSRINLNMYSANINNNPEQSVQTSNNFSDEANTKPSLLAIGLGGGGIRNFKKKSFNQLNLLNKFSKPEAESNDLRPKLNNMHALSVMNLDKCFNKMGFDVIESKSNAKQFSPQLNAQSFLHKSNLSSSTYLLNKNLLFKSNLNLDENENSNNVNKNGLFYLKSSNLNLFKSSNSLNALDLELLDSVSVGSFDRKSLYSNCANSECELNDYYLCGLIESSGYFSRSAANLFQNTDKLDNDNNLNKSASNNLGDHLIDTSGNSSCNNNNYNQQLVNSKIDKKQNLLNWLQKI